MSKIKNKININDQRFLLIVIIVVIFLLVGIVNPNFFSVKTISTILQQISVAGILTMGMAFLMISGGIDLSVGTLMALCGIVISTVIVDTNNTFLALLCGLATGILGGLLNGIIIAKSRCVPLVITLGTSSVFLGLSLIISGGEFMQFEDKFDFLANKIAKLFPWSLFVFFGVVAVMFVVLNYTRLGRFAVAIGGNEVNAYLSGIRVDRYKIIAYVLSGICAFMASIIFASRLNTVVATSGSGYELNAMAAAIIGGVTFEGGCGTIGGAFLGVLLMGVVTSAMTILSINSYYQTAITGAIIVLAVVLSGSAGRHQA